MNAPRIILFDWDDTLVNNRRCIHAAVEAAWQAVGQPDQTLPDSLNQGASLRDVFPEIFGDRWREAREVFYATFERHHLASLGVCSGAREMVAALHEAGVILGVVSNKAGRYLRREAGYLGWNRYFHRLVGAMDAVRDKPAPEPVWLALEGTNVPPGEGVWFVGDNRGDMRCAYEAGCLPVLLRPYPPLPEEFTPYLPRHYFPRCTALTTAVMGSHTSF